MPIELSNEEIEEAYKEGNITDKRLKFPSDQRSLWGVVKALTIRLEKADKAAKEQAVEIEAACAAERMVAEENARLLKLIDTLSSVEPGANELRNSLIIALSNDCSFLKATNTTLTFNLVSKTDEITRLYSKLNIAKNALRPFSELAPISTIRWASLKYVIYDDPDEQSITNNRIHRVLNKAAEAYKQL